MTTFSSSFKKIFVLEEINTLCLKLKLKRSFSNALRWVRIKVILKAISHFDEKFIVDWCPKTSKMSLFSFSAFLMIMKREVFLGGISSVMVYETLLRNICLSQIQDKLVPILWRISNEVRCRISRHGRHYLLNPEIKEELKRANIFCLIFSRPLTF